MITQKTNKQKQNNCDEGMGAIFPCEQHVSRMRCLDVAMSAGFISNVKNRFL